MRHTNSIGERIKLLRTNILKLNQATFGASIGLKQGAISKIEKGFIEPTQQTIMFISLLYDINESWLKDGTGQIENNSPGYFFKQLTIIYQLQDDDIDYLKYYLSESQANRYKINQMIINNISLKKEEG